MTTRRRFLTILAGAATLPAFGIQAATASWKGIALGAEAQIILDHPEGERLITLALAEIRRLESIFSLYQSDSQLARLNRDGRLPEPAFEMIELLSICSSIVARTNGAFDPTVQVLWKLYAEEFTKGAQPTPAQIADAMTLTGWDHVRFSPELVTFDQSGMALTLNGIAQGYIADKVSDIFRQNGIENVLVNTGEISALGTAPNGAAWPIALRGTNQTVPLQDRAIATSAPLGTTFDDGGTTGHIIDPRTGMTGGKWSTVNVIATSAAEADGLSTAFCLMDASEIDRAKGTTEVRFT